jgi:hypothetical protein
VGCNVLVLNYMQDVHNLSTESLRSDSTCLLKFQFAELIPNV